MGRGGVGTRNDRKAKKKKNGQVRTIQAIESENWNSKNNRIKCEGRKSTGNRGDRNPVSLTRFTPTRTRTARFRKSTMGGYSVSKHDPAIG